MATLAMGCSLRAPASPAGWRRGPPDVGPAWRPSAACAVIVGAGEPCRPRLTAPMAADGRHDAPTAVWRPWPCPSRTLAGPPRRRTRLQSQSRRDAAPGEDVHASSGPDLGRRALLKGAAVSLSTLGTGLLAEPLATSAAAATSSAVAEVAAAAAPVAAAPASMSGTAAATYGITALRDPAVNRGLATTDAARAAQGLQGLLPAGRSDPDLEARRAAMAIQRCCTPLEKYQALMTLLETDSRCFYMLLQQDVVKYLPLVYTPTVGDACLSWGTLLRRPTGLTVSLQRHAGGGVRSVINTWPSSEVRIVVLTDGERILGLGDLGAHGMGIPTGKAAVYGAAGVPPPWLLPLSLDVGCDTRAVVDDDMYVGTRAARERGAAYYELVDETVAALQARYGPGVLIHWEDVGAGHAFELLARLRGRGVPTFNDDIEATAAVGVAALLGAERVAGVPSLAQQTFLFFGAGQANQGLAELLVSELQRQGLRREDADARLWLMDSQGIVLDDRLGLRGTKARLAKPRALLPQGVDPRDLAAVVRAVQPTALIGAATVGGAFTADVLKALTEATKQRHGAAARPIVFALSNPTDKAECTFADAFRATGGAAVFASGTQFPPLSVTGASAAPAQQQQGPGTNSSDGERLLLPAQANNCFIFPGLGAGCVLAGASTVTDSMLLAAAHAVADLTSEDDLAQECVLPSVSRLGEVAAYVAAAVVQAAALDMVASPTPIGGGCLALAQQAAARSSGRDSNGWVPPPPELVASIQGLQYVAAQST